MPRYIPPFDSQEKHFYRFNYCGPGTNVWRRMREKVQPMDELDRACFQHDLVTERRGPFYGKGNPMKMRAADRRLMYIARRLAQADSGYRRKGAAAAVAAGMEFVLKTGIRGRRIK